jgi:predicted phage baseplate assembly protein
VDLYLERPIAGIHEDSVQAQSWLLLELPTGDTGVYRVTGVAEASLNGFGISAKTTALKLVNEDGSPPTKSTDFTVRKTTAYLKSEELLLAALPLSGEIASGATQLTLNGLAPELQVGQPVALTGEQADADGVTRSEIAILAAISHNEGFTTLKFTEGLTYSYKRATLTISANVVRATHGETVAQEVLGGGDGAQPNQRFKLKKPPLTHVSAATASGAENRLTVRVNRVEWEQAPSLYGLDGNDRKYVVRIDHDGSAIVIFGDGKQGARLPTGQENVVATYRSGIGAAGEVDAGSLTLLKKRPFGVRGVTNPVAAAGAEDPETRDEARQNAPLTVLTLDRVVSLQDFEDFARAYAGIGKAQAVALWSGETELVHITVAGANGDEIAATSDLLKNLRNAIAGARDPLRAVEIGTFQLRYFDVAAYIQIAPAYLWEDVKGQIESGLINAFSFAARGFGQPATAAEVVNVIHNTPGVVAVDLERFYLIDELGQPVGALLSSVLPTQPVRLNPDRTASGAQRFLPAELVLINPAGITLTEMTP